MNNFSVVWRSTDGWVHIELICLAVASVVQTMFVIVLLRRPWWRLAPTRSLALKSTTLGAALWLTLVNTFFVYHYEEQVSTLVMTAIALAIVYQFYLIIVTPRRVIVAHESDDDTPKEGDLVDGPPTQM